LLPIAGPGKDPYEQEKRNKTKKHKPKNPPRKPNPKKKNTTKKRHKEREEGHVPQKGITTKTKKEDLLRSKSPALVIWQTDRKRIGGKKKGAHVRSSLSVGKRRKESTPTQGKVWIYGLSPVSRSLIRLKG